MRRHAEVKRIVAWLGQDLSPLAVLVCGAILLLSDWANLKGGQNFPGGLVDEPAHFMTALLLLQALSQKIRSRILIPALIASVAIDIDHIPQYLGHYFLTAGTPRPYTHSLLTLVVLLLMALVARRRRDLFVGLAVGIALHFLRDLAEGDGSGVALLWPLSYRAYSYPHLTYVALMICVIAADVGLGLFRLRARPAVP